MPDTAIAHGTPVSWKSKLGYTYEGTVTAGPNEENYYDLITGDGARANVHRDEITVAGEARTEEEQNLSDEQKASLRADRARRHANGRVTDAIMSTYSTLREDAKADQPDVEIEGAALDQLRVDACVLVAEEAEKLLDAMRQRVGEKQP